MNCHLPGIIRNIAVISYIPVGAGGGICDFEGWRPISPLRASFFMSHLTDGGGGRCGHEREDKERREKRKDGYEKTMLRWWWSTESRGRGSEPAQGWKR